MRSFYVVVVATVVMISTSAAQTDPKESAEALQKIKELAADSLPWKLDASLGAGFTSVTLSNWAGGGQSSITMRGLVLGSADYAMESFSWDNDLDVGLSITQLGDQAFRKNDDRFIVTSKAAFKQSDVLRYSGLLDFRSQVAVGYNFDRRNANDSTQFLKISNLFSPAYLTTALGMEWTPNAEFRLLIAPFSARTIFVLDQDLADSGAYGVDPGNNVKVDVGSLINATLEWELVENVTWKSRFNAFMRYDALDLWIVTIENAFLMKVNSFLSVGLLTDLFYDDRVTVVRDNETTGPALQLRNQLVVTFQYALSNF